MTRILIITGDKPGESLIPLYHSMQNLGFAVELELSWNAAARLLEHGEKFGAILASKYLRFGKGTDVPFDLVINLLRRARIGSPDIKLAVIAADFFPEELILLHKEQIQAFLISNNVGIKFFCDRLPEVKAC